MGFVGPVTRFGEAWVRPDDLELSVEQLDGAVEAIIERVVRVGFEVRAELALGDGAPVVVQLTRAEAAELELEEGQIVWVRAHRERVFA